MSRLDLRPLRVCYHQDGEETATVRFQPLLARYRGTDLVRWIRRGDEAIADSASERPGQLSGPAGASAPRRAITAEGGSRELHFDLNPQLPARQDTTRRVVSVILQVASLVAAVFALAMVASLLDIGGVVVLIAMGLGVPLAVHRIVVGARRRIATQSVWPPVDPQVDRRIKKLCGLGLLIRYTPGTPYAQKDLSQFAIRYDETYVAFTDLGLDRAALDAIAIEFAAAHQEYDENVRKLVAAAETDDTAEIQQILDRIDPSDPDARELARRSVQRRREVTVELNRLRSLESEALRKLRELEQRLDGCAAQATSAQASLKAAAKLAELRTQDQDQD